MVKKHRYIYTKLVAVLGLGSPDSEGLFQGGFFFYLLKTIEFQLNCLFSRSLPLPKLQCPFQSPEALWIFTERTCASTKSTGKQRPPENTWAKASPKTTCNTVQNDGKSPGPDWTAGERSFSLAVAVPDPPSDAPFPAWHIILQVFAFFFHMTSVPILE